MTQPSRLDRARSRSPAPTPAAAPGIQADLKTFSALGVFGMTAITAVTVQNTKGVDGLRGARPRSGRRSRSARSPTDIGVDAAKTGMLANAGHRRGGRRRRRGARDPEPRRGPRVRLQARAPAAGGGRGRRAPVAAPAARDARHAEPARGERSRRASPSRSRDDMRRAADAILAFGVRRGPGQGRPPRGPDRGRGPVRVRAGSRSGSRRDRIDTPHTHGTGCTLSRGDRGASGDGRDR